jgi:L-iditol 2-dehydrogenase
MTQTPTNRALLLHGAGDLRLADQPMPVAKEGEVLLRITAVGLCGSDRHAFLEGGIGGATLVRPLILGHEVAGVVVGGPSAGRRVVIDPAIPCRTCRACAAGKYHLCLAIRFAGLEVTDGGLQRYLAWPADRCVAFADGIADRDAPLLEVLGIALHAIDLAEVQAGMRAGVYGAGPIGLVLIRALRAMDVDVAVATDALRHRVVAARASGALEAELVDPAGDAIVSTSAPVDVAFECSGEAPALDRAIRDLVPAGRVLLVGIPAGPSAHYAASPARRKEIGLQWVRRMRDGDLERAAQLVHDGKVRLGGIVTQVYDLEQGATAFADLCSRSGLKVIVKPS